MTLDGLDALETRVRGLVKLVQDLRQKNTSLEEEIRDVRQRLGSQEELNQHLEKERTDIQSRIEKVLGDTELAELIDQPEEVPL